KYLSVLTRAREVCCPLPNQVDEVAKALQRPALRAADAKEAAEALGEAISRLRSERAFDELIERASSDKAYKTTKRLELTEKPSKPAALDPKTRMRKEFFAAIDQITCEIHRRFKQPACRETGPEVVVVPFIQAGVLRLTPPWLSPDSSRDRISLPRATITARAPSPQTSPPHQIYFRSPCPQPILSSLSITEQGVHDSVSSIRTAQNPGPDQVHPAFFKLSVPVIKPILTIMFQRLLDSGTVPSAWKRSIITPVHKGGGFGTDTTDSYRPIASTSIVCRTLERIINKKILDHMEDNGLFSPAQHGFRRRHSCETALAVAVHTLSTYLDQRTPCKLVLLDFSKAFDRIDHALLPQKMEKVGIEGTWPTG
ncbi:hypothetical protein HPB47_022390, partial [Ixodes persulcatus]